MLDLFHHLSLGFSVALSMNNLLLCFVGCMIGTLIGVLPGIGPIATISVLLPFTFGISPEGSLITLAGIYYGAQYGGSTAAILVKMPGESSSIVTIIDGHAMARQGRAGAALAVAAIGSFIAGSAATLVVGAFAGPLGRVALLFGAQEYFSLIILGLMLAIVLAGGSLLRALISVLIGVVMAGVGTDVETGVQRLTFGHLSLLEGFNVSVIAMGIFGVGEILRNLGGDDRAPTVQSKLGQLWPSRDERRRSIFPILRGTALGSTLGLLPGSGTLLAPFASYALEKRLSKHRNGSATARLKALRGRKPRTTPPRKPGSFRCSRSGCRPTR